MITIRHKFKLISLIALLLSPTSCSQTMEVIPQKTEIKVVNSLSFPLKGNISDYKGNPVQGMKIIIETDYQKDLIVTDHLGNYQTTIKQAISGNTLFSFKNAIGDTVYFQKAFFNNQPKVLNFFVDQRGSLQIK